MSVRLADDAGALQLLERSGGPFDLPRYREAWIACFPEYVDVSSGFAFGDGTRAAVALLAKDDLAESLPLGYGGVHATRRLHTSEVRALLELARRRAGVGRIRCRSVPFPASKSTTTHHYGGVVGGWTSVVLLAPGAGVEARLRSKGRRALRVAVEAGASHSVTGDPDAFLNLYAGSSKNHWYRYPDALIREVCSRGLGRLHQVQLDGQVVASVLALEQGSHRVAWLAAQSVEGRRISAMYLALKELLSRAVRDGVTAVNLGISEGQPGVALFKRRFGAVDLPVLDEGGAGAERPERRGGHLRALRDRLRPA